MKTRRSDFFQAMLIAAVAMFSYPAFADFSAKTTFEISFPASAHPSPITGRVFLMISRANDPEIRLQFRGFSSPPIFGLDVDQLKPVSPVVIDASVAGYPVTNLDEIPPGEYYAQAILNKYTEFRRADGYRIWAHMDQWEGQQFNRSPGNLYSKIRKVRFGGAQTQQISLALTETIPAIEVPRDTSWVKRVKIKSKLLSKFWGHPIYLGATVLLPRDYASRPAENYPVIYEQGHFHLAPPLGFSSEPSSGKEGDSNFSAAWSSEGFPRMIAVYFQHPTPYYDESWAVNSVNNGPFGDAIMTELIPYIENRFRIIRSAYARVLTGMSAGGFNSLALQIHHPEFFGGAWIFCPAEIDFRSFYVMDLYEDDNAFTFNSIGDVGEIEGGKRHERYMIRNVEGQPVVSVRQVRQLERVLGSRGRSAFWFDGSSAVFSPIGRDGYPEPIFDDATGNIRHAIAMSWREQGHDLRHYAQLNWPSIGPALLGKLHIYVGDMDEYYVNSGVYFFEEFLETTNPYYAGSVQYGRPKKGHSWKPMSTAELVKVMAEHIASKAPAGESLGWK